TPSHSFAHRAGKDYAARSRTPAGGVERRARRVLGDWGLRGGLPRTISAGAWAPGPIVAADASRRSGHYVLDGRSVMNENRRQILEMLAGGKITADEAERLLAALDPIPTTVEFSGSTKGSNGATVRTRAKYLRV